MTVDILLAGSGIGLGRIRQEGINGPVGIEVRVGLCELLDSPERDTEEFGVAFDNEDFETSDIIDEAIGLFHVDFTADGFGQFYGMLKQRHEERLVPVPEAGKLGSVRNLVEAAELPKLGA